MVQTIAPIGYGDALSAGLSKGTAQGNQLGQQLLPLLIKQQMNQQAFKPSQGQSGSTGLAVNQAGSEGEPNLQPGFGEQKISAEEINRRALASLDPNYTRQLLEDYNAGIQNQQIERLQAIKDRMGGELTAAQEAVAARLDKDARFSGITDPQLRADAISKELTKFTAAFNEFETGAAKRPSPFFFNDYKNKIDNLKNQAKRFIDLGLEDEVRGALLGEKAGWSESEVAQILNPLSQHSKEELSKLAPVFEKKEGKVHFHGFEAQQKRLDSALQKAIQPGKIDPSHPGVIQPGTSLLLVRNQLMKQGVDPRNINSAIGRLVSAGKLQLDAQQNREFQQLSQSPTRGLSLYEVLFGPS